MKCLLLAIFIVPGSKPLRDQKPCFSETQKKWPHPNQNHMFDTCGYNFHDTHGNTCYQILYFNIVRTQSQICYKYKTTCILNNTKDSFSWECTTQSFASQIYQQKEICL